MNVGLHCMDLMAGREVGSFMEIVRQDDLEDNSMWNNIFG